MVLGATSLEITKRQPPHQVQKFFPHLSDLDWQGEREEKRGFPGKEGKLHILPLIVLEIQEPTVHKDL